MGYQDNAISRRDVFRIAGASVAAHAILLGSWSSALAQSSSVAVEVPENFRALLDPNLSATLLSATEVGPSTYYIVQQTDEVGSGDLVFIRVVPGGEPVIIDDVRMLPLEVASVPVAATPGERLDVDVFSYALADADLKSLDSITTVGASTDIDSKLLIAAKEKLNMSSKTAPGTNKGKLACAWAVNQIAAFALKAPIGGGLATANMVKVLRARHLRVSESKLVPGCIVISPTTYSGAKANVGHVGIVGEAGNIYSNSSSEGKWLMNFTIDRWQSYYGAKKGLSVEYYRLDGKYFPLA